VSGSRSPEVTHRAERVAAVDTGWACAFDDARRGESPAYRPATDGTPALAAMLDDSGASSRLWCDR
jgi:hypothetical protein